MKFTRMRVLMAIVFAGSVDRRECLPLKRAFIPRSSQHCVIKRPLETHQTSFKNE
jgi:hypothetical protein